MFLVLKLSPSSIFFRDFDLEWTNEKILSTFMEKVAKTVFLRRVVIQLQQSCKFGIIPFGKFLPRDQKKSRFREVPNYRGLN